MSLKIDTAITAEEKDLVVTILRKVAAGAAGYWPQATRDAARQLVDDLVDCVNCKDKGEMMIVVGNESKSIPCPICQKEIENV